MNYRLHVYWYATNDPDVVYNGEIWDGVSWSSLFTGEAGPDYLTNLVDPTPGIYKVRVQSELSGVQGDWVESLTFAILDPQFLAYRLRVRNMADSADELVLSSLADDERVCIVSPPSGDGQEFNPITGEANIGAYAVEVADRILAGATPEWAVTGKVHDTEGREKLLSNRAYLEYSSDNGATWDVLVAGFLNRYVLLGALRWSFTVGESRRVELRRKIFEKVTNGFLNPTTLIGEPTREAWGPVENFPTAWRCEVTDVTGTRVTLRFASGWGSEESGVGGRSFLTPIGVTQSQRANNMAAAEFVPTSVGAYSGTFPGIEVELIGEADRFMPVSHDDGTLVSPDGSFILEWPTGQPSEGDEYDVRGWRTTIDEASPLHIFKHPIDIVTTLYSEAGLDYNAASATLVKNALGPNLRDMLRITQSYEMEAFITALKAIHGFGVRFNADGEREFFVSRVRNITTPTTTVELDQLRAVDAITFEEDESYVRDRVTVRQTTFVRWSPSANQPRPYDDILAFPRSRTYPETDPGEHEVIYEIPGVVVADVSGVGLGIDRFEAALAAEVLDRFGRAPALTLLPVTNEIAEVVGEELVIDLDHYPIASGRGGLRVLQVIRRTKVPGGADLLCMDTGEDAQPATTPTFTLAQSATDSRKYAELEITNAATLNAAGIRVRVEWGFGSGATPDGGAIVAEFAAGEIPTDPFDLPPVDAGSTVWVRMQSLQRDHRAGAYTAWDSVALDALQPPTDLAIVASAGGDDSLADLSFTPIETDMPHEVYRRLQAQTADDDVLLALLPPGVGNLSLINVTLNEEYTFTVRAAEYSPWRGVSSSVTEDFTAGASGGSLNAPLHQAAEVVPYREYYDQVTNPGLSRFVPGKSSIRVYCLADADAFDQGAKVRFWVAYETAPGSGVFSDAEVFAVTDSIDPTRGYTVSPWLLVPNVGEFGFGALVSFGYSHIRADGLESTTPPMPPHSYTQDPTVPQAAPNPIVAGLNLSESGPGTLYQSSTGGDLLSEAQVSLSRGGTHADLSATGPGYYKQATMGASATVAYPAFSEITGNLSYGQLPTGGGTWANGGSLVLTVGGDANYFAIRRHSATGRAQFRLEDQSGTSLWRVGTTAAGGTTFVIREDVNGVDAFTITQGATPALATGGPLTVNGLLTAISTATGHEFRINNTGTPPTVTISNYDTTVATLHNVQIVARFADTSANTTLNAGLIRWTKEQEWTSTSTTRDSGFIAQVVADGTLTTFMSATSALLVTMPGRLVLSNTQDISGTSATTSAFAIGNTSGQHLAMDDNEIMAKAGPTTTATLALNADGGAITIGNNLTTGNTSNSLLLKGGDNAGANDTTVVYDWAMGATTRWRMGMTGSVNWRLLDVVNNLSVITSVPSASVVTAIINSGTTTGAVDGEVRIVSGTNSGANDKDSFVSFYRNTQTWRVGVLGSINTGGHLYFRLDNAIGRNVMRLASSSTPTMLMNPGTTTGAIGATIQVNAGTNSGANDQDASYEVQRGGSPLWRWGVLGTIAATSVFALRDVTNSVFLLRATQNGGIQVGNPTGGDKGLGTLNVEGEVYRANKPLMTQARALARAAYNP